MDDAQFLVQWDEHPTHLATRLGYLLEHQALVDVTLMCNTHTLKVHRAVLAACSPYFERQLGTHPLIVLKDMKFSVLKSLVEFMYCGETSVSEENLTPLLEAAKFFEVKGLAAMTKETVGAPSVSPSTKTLNGTATPNTSGYSRGGGSRGRGRGRGRPPLNPSAKVGSPTESAQILLSLSGTPQSQPNSQFFTTSKNVKIDPSVIQNNLISADGKSKLNSFEPRRRGRRRGPINSAFREKLLREADTQSAIESLKRDLSDDSDQVGSPLLSSLLSKQDGKPMKLDEAGNSKYLQTLKDFGLPTNVPILLDNGEGKLVTLTEDVLKSVMDTDGNVQFHVTEGPLGETSGGLSVMSVEGSSSGEKKDELAKQSASGTMRELAFSKQKKPRHFVVKEMQASRSDEEDSSTSSRGQNNLLKMNIKAEPEANEEELNEDILESLKNGAATEAEQDPEAVVLFEVTGNKKVEKYVMSAKEVNALKALNEQLAKQKKQLADITKNNLSTIDVVGTNAKVAELKLKIGKTKSILSQVMERAQHGLREKLKTYVNETLGGVSSEKKPQSQVVELEFIDGNGEKIEGYQVEGTVVGKRANESKESMAKDNDLIGFFDMVCDNANENPLLEEEDLQKDEEKSQTLLSSESCIEMDNNDNTKDMSYQLVMNNHIEDQNENISYDHIEAMIGNPSDSIVIDHKNQDLKYIIGSSDNIISQEENYVVYEGEKQPIPGSEYVIYGNAVSVLPDISENENPDTSDFVVGTDPEVIQNEDGTEYIVYGEDKTDLSNEMKEIENSDANNQYIVYTSDENTEKSQERFEMYKGEESVDKEVEDEFVIYPGEKDPVLVDGGDGSDDQERLEEEEVESPAKDVPLAVGLVPLKDALEKFQSISDHQPRRTRSNSSSGTPEAVSGKRRSSANSDNSEKSDKKIKLEPILPEQTDSESS